MRNVLISVAMLVLTTSACVTTGVVTTQKPVAVDVPAHLFKCTGVEYPDPDTMTDADVARLLVDLEGANRECRASMDAVQKYLDAARKRVG